MMTAIAAAIFAGVVATFLSFTDGADAILAVILAVLLGGLIVGLLEWGTFRAYRIPMSPLWALLQPLWMLVLLIAMFIVAGTNDKLIDSAAWWGLALDLPRWLLLRSHFRNALWWVLFCGLGWLIGVHILSFVGAHTIGAIRGFEIVLLPLNGLVNGAWIGFCRGIALTLMVRDRRRRLSSP